MDPKLQHTSHPTACGITEPLFLPFYSCKFGTTPAFPTTLHAAHTQDQHATGSAVRTRGQSTKTNSKAAWVHSACCRCDMHSQANR